MFMPPVWTHYHVAGDTILQISASKKAILVSRMPIYGMVMLKLQHDSVAGPRPQSRPLFRPNGAGKTTLIAQITGEPRPDAGSIRLDGRDVTHLPPLKRSALGPARSCQITSIFQTFSALHNVVLAIQGRSRHSFRFWKIARTPLKSDFLSPHLLSS